MLADKNTMRKEKETSNPEDYNRRIMSCKVSYNGFELESEFFTLITTFMMIQQLLETTIAFKFIERPKACETGELIIFK